MKSENRDIIAVSFLILLTVGIYGNSVGNLFTNWDDRMIYGNPQIRSLRWENLQEIFTPKRGSTYQPIRVLSYAIDYHFWKLNSLGYHITNILFYVLTCIMVFLTLRLLSADLREGRPENSHRRVALFGSFLFAVHPVHVEAVTWLAARKEVLQGFFFFLAFYLYLKGREGEMHRRIVYLCFTLFTILLAVLSKPSAIVFPAVLLIYEIALTGKGWFECLKRHKLFFVAATLISALFSSILIKVMMDAGGVKPYHGGSFINNVLVSFYAFLYHLKLLFFTLNYSAAYTIRVSNPILGEKTILFVGLAIFLFVSSIWSLRKTKVLFFCFFFFFITLLPYLNLIPISTLLADRYVFIASFSWAFILGILLDRLYGYRRKLFSDGFFKLLSVSFFLLFLTGYSFMTIQQNKIWENSFTLWADAVEKYPDSNTANALMGVVYMDIGMDEEAIKYLERAVQILPYDYQSRNNLGIVYGRQGKPEKALKEFTTAIWLNPDNDKIKINLAVLYQREKEYQKAEEIFRFLLAKNNNNGNLHFRLALVYKEMGQYDKAISELTTSMELAPNIINPYEELGNLYLSKLKDPEKAKYYYVKGIEAAPKTTPRVEDLRWQVQDLEK